MTKNFALSLQLKRTKAHSGGNAPIYLIITIDSSRVEVATKRTISQEIWNPVAPESDGPFR
uniref:Arm DNA-binding domain-containing protein n=1 Tax=Mucilaginibacter sp. Bleaf8 TaxID=2834430 RepID=UPI0020BE2447|nr:Arm DNA-binding domain-containing protein [Mucilaginibacter sp. Bleaf8]